MTPDECHLDDAAQWIDRQLENLTLYAALAVLPTRYGEIDVEHIVDKAGDDAVRLTHRGHTRGLKKDKDKRKAAKDTVKKAAKSV